MPNLSKGELVRLELFKAVLINKGNVSNDDYRGVMELTEYIIDKSTTQDKNENTEIYREIINYLNIKAGKSFKISKGAKKLINARFDEGFILSDFLSAIDNQVREWKGTEFEQYLRPETLFTGKMNGYCNNGEKRDQLAQVFGESEIENGIYEQRGSTKEAPREF